MSKKREVPDDLPEDDNISSGLAMLPATGVNPILARLLPSPGTSLADCPTSLDLQSQEGRELAFNSTSMQTLELDDKGELTMTCEHYLVHPAKIVDPDSGEEKNALRAVFISPDGETYATTSEVVVRRLAEMLSLFDGARFDRPVRIRITERRARRSKQLFHDLRFAPSAGDES